MKINMMCKEHHHPFFFPALPSFAFPHLPKAADVKCDLQNPRDNQLNKYHRACLTYICCEVDAAGHTDTPVNYFLSL